jgi:magnesium transporter
MKQVVLEKSLRIARQFLKLRTLGHLWNALNKLHSADVATLIEHLSPQERALIIQLFFDRNLEVSRFSEIISEIEPDIAVPLLQDLDIAKIIPILEKMSSDDAAALIALLPEVKQQEVLKKMKKEDAVDIQEQLAYPEKSAGRVMTSNFLAFDEATAVGDAITAIQLAGEEVEVPFYLYVVDEDQHLKGVVSMKQLILVKPRTPLKEIMNTDVYKADVFTGQEEAAAMVANYNLLALPVVDELHRLVGVITVDDIIDIIQDEAAEDIYKLAGVTRDYHINLGIFASLKKRIPWLTLSLFTTAFSAVIVAIFKGSIRDFIWLAVFMPIVAAVGGVVGNQNVAIIVRELVEGTLKWSTSKSILFRQFIVGIGSGVFIGIISGFVSYLVSGLWILGVIFAAAIIINLSLAALFGTLIPLILKFLKQDPALASGMLVTMLTDIIGYLSFLGLAALILPHFLT